MITLKITRNGLKIQLTNKAEFIEFFSLVKDSEGIYNTTSHKTIGDALGVTGYLGNNWFDLTGCLALYSGEVFGYDTFLADNGQIYPDPKETFYHDAITSFWFEDLINSKHRYIILPRMPFSPEYAKEFKEITEAHYEANQ